MQDDINILLLQTEPALSNVKMKQDNFSDRIYNLTKTNHTVYIICDKWPKEPLSNLPQFDGIIVSGSAAMLDENKPWMKEAVRIIQEAIALEMPLLGICFGHQLLGKACGANVGPNPHGRHLGSSYVTIHDHNDALFQNLPSQFSTQVSHRDVILNHNDRFVVIGSAPHDPFHCIRAGKCAWGVQFHPEWNTSIVKAYLQARKHLFEQEWGENATEKQIANLQDSLDAPKLLLHFINFCRHKKNAKDKKNKI